VNPTALVLSQPTPCLSQRRMVLNIARIPPLLRLVLGAALILVTTHVLFSYSSETYASNVRLGGPRGVQPPSTWVGGSQKGKGPSPFRTNLEMEQGGNDTRRANAAFVVSCTLAWTLSLSNEADAVGYVR
jgi:hypothetical protein